MGIYINGVLVNYVKPPIHFVVLLIIVLNSCGSPISLEPTAQIYEYSNLPVITPNNASSLSTLITIAGNNATEGTVAISANGKMIALAPIDSASGNTFNTGIWGTKSGELLTLLDYERNTDGNIRSLVFSLDGQFIITGSDKGVIQYWDVMSGNRVFNFTTNQNAINELAINPDGHILASVGYDNTVLVFVLETGEVKISYNHGDIVSAVAFDRTGR